MVSFYLCAHVLLCIFRVSTNASPVANLALATSNRQDVWPAPTSQASNVTASHGAGSASELTAKGYELSYSFGNTPLHEASAYANLIRAAGVEALEDFAGVLRDNKTYTDKVSSLTEISLVINHRVHLPRSILASSLDDIVQCLAVQRLTKTVTEVEVTIRRGWEDIAAIFVMNHGPAPSPSLTSDGEHPIAISNANMTRKGHLGERLSRPETPSNQMFNKTSFSSGSAGSIANPTNASSTVSSPLVKDEPFDPQDITLDFRDIAGTPLRAISLFSCISYLIHAISILFPTDSLSLTPLSFYSEPSLQNSGLVVQNLRPSSFGDPKFDMRRLLRGLWILFGIAVFPDEQLDVQPNTLLEQAEVVIQEKGVDMGSLRFFGMENVGDGNVQEVV